MNRSQLKQNAKNSLKGKYGEAFKIMLIYYLISFGVSVTITTFNFNEVITSILFLIASIVIGGLLFFGYNSFFLKISRNDEATCNDLFSKTSLFWTFIILTLSIEVFTFLWSLLFIIPGIIAAINYSIVYLVALDNPELSAMEIIRKSKAIMTGHKMDCFILYLSFIGWAILGVFTFGILYIWLVPYMQVTFANFYNEIKN